MSRRSWHETQLYWVETSGTSAYMNEFQDFEANFQVVFFNVQTSEFLSLSREYGGILRSWLVSR